MQGETEHGATKPEAERLAESALGVESLLAAAALGYWAHSWWVFGGVLLLGFMVLSSRPLAGLVATFMALFWGALGWEAGRSFGNGDLGAIVVLTCLGLLLGIGVHAGAIMWFVDWIKARMR